MQERTMEPLSASDLRVATTVGIPGVPLRLFATWAQAHDAVDLEEFANKVMIFLEEAVKHGVAQEWINGIAARIRKNLSDAQGNAQYAPSISEESARANIDGLFSAVHDLILGKTGTTRTEWYDAKRERSKQIPPPQPPSPERGLGGPYLDELWQRSRQRELGARRASEEKEFTIRITVEDINDDEDVLDRNPHCPKHVKDGITFLETHLAEKGYEDVHSTLVKNPRMTERGVLYAEGTFVGPSPNDGEQRDPEDFSDAYRFIVVEDSNYEDLYLIEVYYSTRKLATFEITDVGLKLVSGEIEHI